MLVWLMRRSRETYSVKTVEAKESAKRTKVTLGSGEAAAARSASWTGSGTSPALTAAGLTKAPGTMGGRSHAQLLRGNVRDVTGSGTLRGSASKKHTQSGGAS